MMDGQDIELDKVVADPTGNKLLASLPYADLAKLRPYLDAVQFAQGHILVEAGSRLENVYFPLNGMISLVVVMNDGKAIETGTIGRESVFGAKLDATRLVSHVRAVIQVALMAVRIPISQFIKLAEESEPIYKLALRNEETMLSQARVTAACNALHKVEARFCRWLLQTRQIVESDTIPLTQEFLAEMLGVRRTSVTEVATKLQAAGVISYSRGVIKITNVESLRAMSCECFETLKQQRAI